MYCICCFVRYTNSKSTNFRLVQLCVVLGEWKKVNLHWTYLDISVSLRNKTVRRQFLQNKTHSTIPLDFRGVVSAGYYALALNAGNLTGNIYLNVALTSFVDVPSHVCSHLFPLWIGRKKTLLISLLFGSLSCLGSIFVVLYADSCEYNRFGKAIANLIIKWLLLACR